MYLQHKLKMQWRLLESLAKGDITSAVQAMSLVEGVTDMALGAIPDPNALDMTGIDFAKIFLLKKWLHYQVQLDKWVQEKLYLSKNGWTNECVQVLMQKE